MANVLKPQQLTSADIRSKTIALSCRTGAGHLAPSLSTVEMLTVLFRDFLQFDPAHPTMPSRDRFILSKGHGCYAYYVVLNALGIIPDVELETFYTDESSLTGCLSMNLEYMIEASTGSLGHGLPIAVGMALAFKHQQLPNRVVCMVGDGEMQEGSNYEALQFAVKFGLDNLLLMIDANSLQAMDKTDDVALTNNTLARLLQVYAGPHFADVDGHDEVQLSVAMGRFFKPDTPNSGPSILFCRTIKGKGIEFMENIARYHFRCPTEDGYVHTLEPPE